MVNAQERARRGECHGLRQESVVLTPTTDESVGRHGPLERDERSLLHLGGDEMAIERKALGLEHAHGHVNARLAQDSDAAACHFGKRVSTSHHAARDARAHDEFGAGRRAAIVRTGFKAHVDGAVGQQRAVGRAHGADGIDLGVGLSATHVKAFADDAVAVDYDGPHHGVGRGVERASTGQLDAAAHPFFVLYGSVHRFFRTFARGGGRNKGAQPFAGCVVFVLSPSEHIPSSPILYMSKLLTEILGRLSSRYTPGEARAVAFALLEDAFGVGRTDVYADKVRQFSEEEEQRLEAILRRIGAGMPLQYATGVARFDGRLLRVTPATLIPRPETEELVALAAERAKATLPKDGAPCRLLDVGTGSGCIAISLALRLGNAWQVSAWDIDEEALNVARENARCHGAAVDFEQVDLLAHPMPARPFDLIVSNPPYICQRERAEMEAQVLDYEPERALFVPDDDPLLFYRALVHLAQHALRPAGWLLLEVNRAYAEATAELLRQAGMVNVEVRCDAFGNPRMVLGSCSQ